VPDARRCDRGCKEAEDAKQQPAAVGVRELVERLRERAWKEDRRERDEGERCRAAHEQLSRADDLVE